MQCNQVNIKCINNQPFTHSGLKQYKRIQSNIVEEHLPLDIAQSTSQQDMYHGKHYIGSKKTCEYKAKCVVTIKCKVLEKRPNGHVVQTWPLAQGGGGGSSKALKSATYQQQRSTAGLSNALKLDARPV